MLLDDIKASSAEELEHIIKEGALYAPALAALIRATVAAQELERRARTSVDAEDVADRVEEHLFDLLLDVDYDESAENEEPEDEKTLLEQFYDDLVQRRAKQSDPGDEDEDEDEDEGNIDDVGDDVDTIDALLSSMKAVWIVRF